MMTACVNDSEESDSNDTLITVGDKIPVFDIHGTDGQVVSSESLAGQTYILNFFDTTCPDCRKGLKELQLIYEKYGSTVPILNVPRSQTNSEVQEYWNQNGLTMSFYTTDNGLYHKFARRIIPRTYVIGRDGRISAAFSDSPVANYDTLNSILEEAINNDMVNLKLRVKVPRTRGGIEEYYFHNEYAINRLDVWFFDSETKKFFTKAIIGKLTEENASFDTQYDITYIFEDVRLHAGVYDIFTIANYEFCPDSVEYEEELLNMVDSITYKRGIEASMPESGPVMTNRATSLTAIDLVPWVNKEYVLNVELERVIAKLQIGMSQNTFQLSHDNRKYADINITNYKLVNLNREYYLFQHRDSLTELGMQPDFTMPDHFSHYSDKGQQYVIDPHFYKKTNSSNEAAAFKYLYESWFGNFNTEDFASMPSANNYGYVYILENTAFKTSQKNGYTPGIVFKAAVSPVFVYLYDYDKRTLQEEHRPEYWPHTIYLYNYNFYGSIHAVNVASGLQLDELMTYNDAQLKAYGIKQCQFNMGVYETYYTYWIRHRNNGLADPMGPMEYGIVRNNFYRIIVSGVSGIGNSVITPEVMRDNHPNSYTDIMVN